MLTLSNVTYHQVGEYAGGSFPLRLCSTLPEPAGPPSTCTTTPVLADEGRFGLRGSIGGGRVLPRGTGAEGEAKAAADGVVGAAAPVGKARNLRFSLTGEEWGGAGFIDAMAPSGIADKPAVLCMFPVVECGRGLRGGECGLPVLAGSIPGPMLWPPADHEVGGRGWLTDRSSKGPVEPAVLEEVFGRV